MTSAQWLPCPLSVECGQIKEHCQRGSESETNMLISLFLSLFLPLQLAVFPLNYPSAHEVALKGH